MSTNQWALDPSHSEVEFKVKHLMITNVTGRLGVISAEIETENADFSASKVHFTADAASISTGNEQRDGHLKSADFFDVENHPTIAFESERFDPASGLIEGTLTIRGAARPVAFDVEFLGANTDPWGNVKAGFSLAGKINRTDWGLGWNAALEAGGVLVSEEVKLAAELQFVKKQG